MKLFDIVGGKVVIHNDALGIPCFRRIWDKYKNKDIANNIISYVVLNNKPDSPYVESIGDTKARAEKLMRELHIDETYDNDEILLAEEEYRSFINTLLVQLLSASRHSVSVINSYLNGLELGTMDMKNVKEALSAIGSLDKVVRSINSLEKQVRKEELESSTVRGGSEIGHFEIPKKK